MNHAPKRKTIPTADEVLAQQKADHAPRPVPPRAKASPASAPPSATAPSPSTPAVSPKTASPKDGGAIVPASQTLPATPDARTNVERYLDEVAPSMIVGRMVKFSKDNKYVVNDTQEEIGPETEFIAVCDQTLVGRIKFSGEEGVPPTRVMGLLYGGFVMPPREELGDLDESRWPIGLSGLPDDPGSTRFISCCRTSTRRSFSPSSPRRAPGAAQPERSCATTSGCARATPTNSRSYGYKRAGSPTVTNALAG